jgi:hypothetical protein
VNPDNHGFVTLFRVYPKHIDAEEQYEKELNDPKYQEQLKAYNLLQQRVANKLFAMLRDPEQKVTGWENPPYTSFTSGYRSPEYTINKKDKTHYHIYALKAFPMSPNSNEISMQVVRNYVLKARDLVIEELLEETKLEPESLESARISQTKARTTDNWFGENEYIPIKYLIPSSSTSIEETLKNIPFCAHVNNSQLGELTKDCKIISIEAGSLICSEGDKADKVYVILEGKVKVYKKDKKGNETEIATIDKGNMFGEMALFDKGIRSASVKTIEPCQLLIFDGDKFLELLLG